MSTSPQESGIRDAWHYHNPVKIHFGDRALNNLTTIAFKNPLIVTSKGTVARGAHRLITDRIKTAGPFIYDDVKPNPDISDLDSAALKLSSHSFDCIIGLGGGSVLDTAKIFSVLFSSSGDFNLAAHFGDSQPIPENPPVPVIAIPTTSGTGSEVTPFATVWDQTHSKKYSLATSGMFPQLALLDPVLTHSLPWDTTLATGLDALCQALESIWNRNATPLTIGIAQQAANLAWQCLRRGSEILGNPALRSDMMQASVLAGLAISQTRTALCHSISYPITARFGVPHGIACGVWMPRVLAFNSSADDGRLGQTAAILGFESTSALVDALEKLLVTSGAWNAFRLQVPDNSLLRDYTAEMLTPGRSDNNLRKVSASIIASQVLEIQDK